MHDMCGWTWQGQGATDADPQTSYLLSQRHDHKWVGYEVIVSSLAFGLGKMDVPLKLRSKASLRMSLGWKPSCKLDDP